MDQCSEHEAGPATPLPQHSLGPWVYDPERGEVLSFAVSGRYIVAESVTRRNGPAIAALPNLLAALTETVRWLDELDVANEAREVIRRARFAIAKAEGGDAG